MSIDNHETLTTDKNNIDALMNRKRTFEISEQMIAHAWQMQTQSARQAIKDGDIGSAERYLDRMRGMYHCLQYLALDDGWLADCEGSFHLIADDIYQAKHGKKPEAPLAGVFA